MFPYQAINMVNSEVKFNMGGSGIYLCLELLGILVPR